MVGVPSFTDVFGFFGNLFCSKVILGHQSLGKLQDSVDFVIVEIDCDNTNKEMKFARNKVI